jgi:hypothetical protein
MSRDGDYVGTVAMARALGCTPETVRGYCEAGLFPGAKRLPGKNQYWRIPRKFFLDARGGSHPANGQPGSGPK